MFLSDELLAELLIHKTKLEMTTLRALFESDPKRNAHYICEAGELVVDFSKSLITDEIFSSLLKIPSECRLNEKIEAMFTGEKINATENRAVLHTALRANGESNIFVDGADIVPEIQATLSRMQAISADIIAGKWLGSTGIPISHVVNIGIGGSDLGPAMAVHALTPYKISNIEQYFVSNVDPADITMVLEKCNPESTLFIVASKTFTTTETLRNANIAKTWLQIRLPDVKDLSGHFIALSTNLSAAQSFGVRKENVIGFWDWVGGRFSLSSAIGLSLMIRIGPEQFGLFLQGMRQMDRYYRTTEFEKNAIVLYSLLGIWYRNFLNYSSYAILPYDTLLARFPAYLQQLIMESNGKSVDQQDKQVDYNTSFVIWGEPGTNGQHSFHQLLHQGTEIIPVDFLFAAKGSTDFEDSHNTLVANALAQAKVLAFGSDDTEPPHRKMGGNRPSVTILYQQLKPYTLGQLIAFYEHVVFTQGVIWNINSFDQWGVELGKRVATSILPLLQSETVEASLPEGAIIELIQKIRRK